MSRYLDDFQVGECFQAPGFTLSEGQILDYGLMYDPQPIHIDLNAAAKGPYGGVIASGFQTLSLCFRMVLQSGIFETVSMGGPGIDELRFLAPVRPGDTVSPATEILSIVPSRSKPDRGVMKIRFTGVNQHGDEVISFVVIMIGRRKPEESCG